MDTQNKLPDCQIVVSVNSNSSTNDETKIQEDKIPDSSETSVQQKTKVSKTKKRKRVKDSTAPKQPLTGYVRYLNDRRDAVRTENPSFSFAEITKFLANEWTNLPLEIKQQYLDAAEVDRERYTKEFNAYKETEAYKLFAKQQSEKKHKEIEKNDKEIKVVQQQQPSLSKDNLDLANGNYDIPIFTEEFMDHNKARDSELRQLRKSNTDYEQQNAILQTHIETMKNAINKLEGEISHQEKNNKALQKHLDFLRQTLTAGFSNIKIPGIKEWPTIQTIDSYMTNLHSILLENNSNDANLLQTVRDVIGRLDFVE